MNCHVLIHGAPNRARSVLAQTIGRASLRATVAAIDAPVQRAADKQSLLRPLAGFAGIDQVYGLAALRGDEVACAGLLFHPALPSAGGRAQIG